MALRGQPWHSRSMPFARELTLDNWLSDAFRLRSFQRMRELLPSALIARSSAGPALLPTAAADLGGIELEGADGATTTVARQLETSYAEGLCVLKDGAIVHEQYLNGLTEHTPHLMMSLTKSLCATLVGLQIGRGLYSRDTLATDLVPELAGTSLDGATVSHLIDMTAGTLFSETYDELADPGTETALTSFTREAGYRRLGDRTPIGVLGHFRTYPLARPHGAWFDYRTPLTNVVGRIVELAAEQPFAEVVSRELWGPLGQEHDASISLDPLGVALAGGGMSCTLRDLARLGLAYQQGGVARDQQVIPADWVADTAAGGEGSARAFAACETMSAEDRAGWDCYRNAFWIAEPGETYSGIGMLGQACYIDRPSGVVIARFSSYPLDQRSALGRETFRSFHAITEALT